ncbi:MAG: hypothetical protein ACU0CI_11970 [Shimia sp.]
MNLKFFRAYVRVPFESGKAFDRKLAALDAALPQSLSVVGNAQSILRTSYGADIDSRPTLRFNQVEIADPAAQGARWDFVASSQDKTFAKYATGPRPFHTLLFTPYRRAHYDHLAMLDTTDFVLEVPVRLSRKTMVALRAKPSVGATTMALLAALGRRDVHFYGFDFKATPNVYKGVIKRDPHDYDREKVRALEMIAANGWTFHRAPEA